jgi:hypothetical protein
MKLETRNLKSGVLALVLALLTGCEQPTLPKDGFAAKAELDAETLHVGDVVTLTFSALHAPGSTVQFPTIGNRKEVVVRGRSIDTSVPAEGVLKTEQIVQLTSLRTGNWLITTNAAICTFSDGTRKAQALPELVLNVQSTLTDGNATSLSDIKGPIHPLSRKIWMPVLIALLALLAGLITLLFMKRKKSISEPEPIIPPHIRAREALAALRTKEWIPEPFFVDLSLILRTYLEDRFDLNAPESTTEELAGKLKTAARLDLKNRLTLNRFFEQSDLVKFARAGAEQDVMQTAFQTVEQFVNQTTECPAPDKETQNEES